MRIYAFTDLHGNEKALRTVRREAKKADLLICTGDLTIFEHEMEKLLRKLDTLKVQTLMLHGNHEEEEEMRAACEALEHVTFLHRELTSIDGYHFLAYGGGGFSERYPDFERWLKQKRWRTHDWSRTIILSHAPPYKTTLDNVGEEGMAWHVGSKSLRDATRKRKPLLVLAGHIHECNNTEDTIGPTLVANPGPSGRAFDLRKLYKERTRTST